MIALVVAGCAGGSGPTPIVIYVTPAPSTSTAPGLGDTIDYVAFLAHVSTSQDDEQVNLNAVGDAYGSGGFAAAEQPASYYKGWATGEIAWLDAHEPAACFEALHKDWRATLVAYGKAMDAFLAHDETNAESYVRSGTAFMERASADIDAVSC